MDRAEKMVRVTDYLVKLGFEGGRQSDFDGEPLNSWSYQREQFRVQFVGATIVEHSVIHEAVTMSVDICWRGCWSTVHQATIRPFVRQVFYQLRNAQMKMISAAMRLTSSNALEPYGPS